MRMRLYSQVMSIPCTLSAVNITSSRGTLYVAARCCSCSKVIMLLLLALANLLQECRALATNDQRTQYRYRDRAVLLDDFTYARKESLAHCVFCLYDLRKSIEQFCIHLV